MATPGSVAIVPVVFDPEGQPSVVLVRQYRPALGRWASPDPLFVHEPGQLQERPGERNLYRYAANNPIAFTDPTGTSVWTKLGKIAVKVYNLSARQN